MMMNLKIFSLMTFAIGALGISSAAHADLYQFTHTGAYNDTGVYMGLQGGYGEVDYGDAFKHTFNGASGSVDEDGIAGRGYIGVQFNPYIGIEGGYSRFSDNKYRIHAVDGNGNKFNIDTKFETQQVDALLKVGTPFGCSGFRGDIKAGAAYIMTDATTDGHAPANFHYLSHTVSDSEDTFVPAAGASISYHLNKNISFDVSYLHGFGKSKYDSPSTDLTTLGVSYLFA